MRIASFALVAALLAISPAVAQEYADVAVSEADYAKLRKLSYARALAEKRTSYDRANKAKYEAEYQAELKASGWDAEKLERIELALGEAANILAYEKGDEEGMSPEDLKEGLGQLNKATVATARAHYKEVRGGADDHQRAEEQVRKERQEAAAGTPPTAAAIQGLWVPDIDATFNDLAPGLPIDAKGREAMVKATDGLSYQFGPGDTIIATSKGSDGKPRVEKGTFRIEGRQIFFKTPGGRREYDLDAGMKGSYLALGKGFGKVLYKKK